MYQPTSPVLKTSRCAFLVFATCALATRSYATAIIIDNGTTGYNVLSGAWSTSTSAAGYYGTNYGFLAGSASATGTVEYRPTIPVTGSYEVAVWYNTNTSPSTQRASDCHYTVDSASGSTAISVNQQTNGMRWYVLGTFTFNAGTTGRVSLTNQTANASPSGRSIIADAVRFQTLPATFTESGASIVGFSGDVRSASLADIDNDGDLDLFYQMTAGAASRVMFRNNFIGTGTLNFTDISSTVHSPATSCWSAAWGDYNGDGLIDVYVGQSNSSASPATSGALLRNDGAAGFTDVSASSGLNETGFEQNVVWADVNNDGLLDMLIGMEVNSLHQVYLQGPAGHFTAVGAQVGFQAPEGIHAYGMAVGDTDGDGDLDVYISTCRPTGSIRNNFYKNMLKENLALSFVDVADTNGTQDFDNTYDAEMVDFDDDGDLDLFVLGADSKPSKIFRNNGNGTFTDVDTITGHALFSDTGGDLNGGRVLDYDNDGYLDIYAHDHQIQFGKNHARLLYRNTGNWNFTNVTVQEGLDEANLDQQSGVNASFDGTWGDIDNDGDLDLLDTVGTMSGFVQPQRVFLSNVSTNGNHWAYFRLKGTPANTTAIDAQLYATINTGTPQQRTLRRDANNNAGTFNQSDLPVHFGLGAATQIDTLRVVWPNGLQQIYNNIPANHYVKLTIYSRFDFDKDLDVDKDDLSHFISCRTRANVAISGPGCSDTDTDGDGDCDLDDFGTFQRCVSGAGHWQTSTACLTPPVIQ